MKRIGIVIQVLFAGVLGANILSMSLMNFFEAPSKDIFVVYVICMVSVIALMIRRAPELPQLTGRQHIFCIAFGVVIFLPRFPYLMEGVLGYAVNVVGDDYLHLQHISSIVHTAEFPPRSTFDDSQYLSYYYAPWMLGAALYETGIFSTVKQAMGLMILVYCLLFSYGVTYASRILFPIGRIGNVFLTVCVMYGGFDFFYWMSGLSAVPSHSEWWAMEFGFEVQYSNFFTLVLWVQQHVLAAFAILYALFIVDRSTGLLMPALAGIFFLSALFSSVFVSIGALPLLAWYFGRSRLNASILAIVAAFLFFSIPLLWIFLGRTGLVHPEWFGELDLFWMAHKRAAFLVFLLIASLELMPLLAAAFVSIKRENVASRAILFALCALVILTTFFVSFTVGNNYAMRGTIIPIFTLIYLAIPVLSEWFSNVRSVSLKLLIAGYLLGGISEYASFWRMSLLGFFQSRTDLNVAVLRFNEGASELTGVELARLTEDIDDSWYLLERNRPSKRHVTEDDIATMGPESRYRITASDVVALYRRWNYNIRGTPRTRSADANNGT